MNLREQFAALDVLIERAENWDFDRLNREIADFRDDQDVVECLEGTDCICERFDLARDAVDDANSSEAVLALKNVRQEFIDEVKLQIKALEQDLELDGEDELEHHTRQGTIETIERLEGIIEENLP